MKGQNDSKSTLVTNADTKGDPYVREVSSIYAEEEPLIEEISFPEHTVEAADPDLERRDETRDDAVWMRDFFAPPEESADQAPDLAPEHVVSHSYLSQTQVSELETPASAPVIFGPGGQAFSPTIVTKLMREETSEASECAPPIHSPTLPQQNPVKAEKPQIFVDAKDGSVEDPTFSTLEMPQTQSEKREPIKKEIHAKSDDEAVAYLANLQLIMAVPTLHELRKARPLRRAPDEIYASQFILQAARRKAQQYMNSQKGMREFHPHMEDGVFGVLDDGTEVIYQTNGIARVQQVLQSRDVKCDKTGAPGIFSETKQVVAKVREGRGRSGLAGAQSITTREKFQANMFYSFISSFLWFACNADVQELGEEDGGERVFVRRGARDFRQYWYHSFPIAKHLCQVIDHENRIMMKNFLFNPGNESSLALVHYDMTTLRGWQTYDQEGKPPKEDAALLVVTAAREGRSAELERLVFQKGLDINSIIAEFGQFGGFGKVTSFTRCSTAYAIEGTALIEAIRLGWKSVVECILNLADKGIADINIVCSEWNPQGTGGPGLRQHYTALDIARLYHRKDIERLLFGAGAKRWQECPRQKRENPFDAAARQDKGEYGAEDFGRQEDHFDEFSFAEFEGVEMDADMKAVTKELQKEMKESLKAEDKEKFFRKLALRWHPDKHPDEKKGFATRIFQWIQHLKDSTGWASKAWAA